MFILARDYINEWLSLKAFSVFIITKHIYELFNENFFLPFNHETSAKRPKKVQFTLEGNCGRNTLNKMLQTIMCASQLSLYNELM